MANNLYDIVASKGRLGDSELRTVDGVPSHVNEYEAELIDKFGSTGERVVKDIGSGNINPETGLPEYEPISATTIALVGAAAAVTSMGMNMYSSLAAGGEQRRGWRREINELEAQKSSLLEDIGKAGGEARDHFAGIIEGFSDQVGQLTSGVGSAFEDAYSTVEQAFKKTGGLATGAVQDMSKNIGQGFQEQFGLNMESLTSDVGQQISGLFEDYTAQQDLMNEQVAQMTRQQKDLRDQVEESKWFWQ